LRIIVCVKQVPGSSKVEVDEKTGVLKRAGVEAKLNPYDLYALEAAARLKDACGGGIIIALTMGPPQAKEALEEAYMMGADEMVLLTDRRFGGSDVLATAYALAQAIGKIGGYDLIICGKQTTDGDTAQVGPEIAELLSIPNVSNVLNVLSCEGSILKIEHDSPAAVYTAEVSMPCLISVEKTRRSPRLPSYKRKKTLKDVPFTTLSLDDLEDRDEAKYGLDGSATRVDKIFPPERRTDRALFKSGADEAARHIFDELIEGKQV